MERGIDIKSDVGAAIVLSMVAFFLALAGVSLADQWDFNPGYTAVKYQ